MHSGIDLLQTEFGERKGELKSNGGSRLKKLPANYHTNPAELQQEIIKSREKDALTPRAVEMLQIMAREASKKLRYRDEEDRKDCIAFAMMDVVKYWRSYNPEKSKDPFAYFTQMIKHGFAKGWRKLHPPAAGDKISLSQDNIYTI
jgi:hypothetical protein